jgi:hypothetical protein
MRIFRFNETVGFDNPEDRDRLEIPNLKGELDPSNPDMRHFYTPTDKVNSSTEVKKILFRYPLLNNFRKRTRMIEGSLLISFYATGKIKVNGLEFYSQISFAYHNNQYYIGTVFRELEDLSDEGVVVNNFYLDDINDVFEVIKAFMLSCEKLGVVEDKDLKHYSYLDN